MFVAEATGRPGFIVPGLIAAVVAELLMGRLSVTTVAAPARRPEDRSAPARERAAELEGMYKGGVAKNVLGTDLEPCGFEPLTGFYRDGCCNTGGDDAGVHVVCAQMTAEFLAFSQAQGNDLSTAVPEPASPVCGPATAGACARPAGRTPWMRASHRPCTSMRPTSRRWSGARSTPCAATRSTNPVANP